MDKEETGVVMRYVEIYDKDNIVMVSIDMIKRDIIFNDKFIESYNVAVSNKPPVLMDLDGEVYHVGRK